MVTKRYPARKKQTHQAQGQIRERRDQSRPVAGLVYNTKRGHMDKMDLKIFSRNFAPMFEELKQLARELRGVLFPVKHGTIFTGKTTFQDYDIMYNRITDTFSRVIDRLWKEKRAIVHARRLFCGYKGIPEC